MKLDYINKDYFSKNKNTSFKLEYNKNEFLKAIDSFEIPYSNEIKLPRDMQFGLEIEFEGVLIDKLSDVLLDLQMKNELIPTEDWYAKDDMTVSTIFADDYVGGEVNSPILTGLKQEWRDLKLVCDTIKNMDGYVTNNCGLHAHFDFLKLGFTNQDILNLIILWYKYEDVIYKFSCGEDEELRSGVVRNAGSIRNLINILMERCNLDCLFQKKFILQEKIFGLDISRYQKYINDMNYDYSTIEFRTGNGTLNPAVIQNYIRLYSHLLKTVKNSKGLLKLENKLSKPDYFSLEINLNKACSFADLIFDNNYDKACFIKQYKK